MLIDSITLCHLDEDSLTVRSFVEAGQTFIAIIGTHIMVCHNVFALRRRKKGLNPSDPVKQGQTEAGSFLPITKHGFVAITL